MKPERVMFDFELATINAIQKYFPQVDVKGCFFHLTKKFWKKIQNVGLKNMYGTDTEFAVHLRMLAALAFVPVNKVVEAYEAIVQLPFFNDNELNFMNAQKQEFLNYIETNNIGSPGRTQGARKAPSFPIPLWNMYELTLSGRIHNNYKKTPCREYNRKLL